jgi:hypothetical protein
MAAIGPHVAQAIETVHYYLLSFPEKKENCRMELGENFRQED